MRRTMCLVMALASVSSDAAVLCTAKSGSGIVRVRTTCSAAPPSSTPPSPPWRHCAGQADISTLGRTFALGAYTHRIMPPVRDSPDFLIRRRDCGTRRGPQIERGIRMRFEASSHRRRVMATALGGLLAATAPALGGGATDGTPVVLRVFTEDLRTLPAAPGWQTGDPIFKGPVRRQTHPPNPARPPHIRQRRRDDLLDLQTA